MILYLFYLLCFVVSAQDVVFDTNPKSGWIKRGELFDYGRFGVFYDDRVDFHSCLDEETYSDNAHISFYVDNIYISFYILDPDGYLMYEDMFRGYTHKSPMNVPVLEKEFYYEISCRDGLIFYSVSAPKLTDKFLSIDQGFGQDCLDIDKFESKTINSGQKCAVTP